MLSVCTTYGYSTTDGNLMMPLRHGPAVPDWPSHRDGRGSLPPSPSHLQCWMASSVARWEFLQPCPMQITTDENHRA